jgi:hypothetical protein
MPYVDESGNALERSKSNVKHYNQFLLYPPLFKILLSTPDSPQNSLFPYITTLAAYAAVPGSPPKFAFDSCIIDSNTTTGFFIAPLSIATAAWQY